MLLSARRMISEADLVVRAIVGPLIVFGLANIPIGVAWSGEYL